MVEKNVKLTTTHNFYEGLLQNNYVLDSGLKAAISSILIHLIFLNQKVKHLQVAIKKS